MPASWDDGPLEKTADESVYQPPPPRQPAALWLLAGVLTVLALASGYLYLRRAPAPAPAQAADRPSAPAETLFGGPLGAEAAAIDLPPLDQSDAIVRELVRHLSAHPQVAAWLATEGLLRNFTVVVDTLAEGKTPTPVLRPLRPSQPFSVIDSGGEIRIDPRAYDRYDGVAEAMASIDPAGAARLYTTLKPRIEEAYAELGHPGTTFDSILEQAIVQLLQTPIPAGALRLKPKGATGYQYEDARLEALPAAQKQLLRMGPRSAAAVQQRLRLIAQALNIPASRLPPQP